MIKKAMLKIIILSIAFFIKGNAQNLVPNPSFEVLDSCSSIGGYGYLFVANPWFQPFYSSILNFNVDDMCSSDLFNSCYPLTSNSNSPSNSVGYQFAQTGDGYSGIIIYTGSSSIGGREYIETMLIDEMKANKKYCIEFYVSLADSSKFGIGDISAYFSNDSLIKDDFTYAPIIVNPQIKNDSTNIITNKTDWVLISGEFIANGGEKFITIGNFKTDSNTNYQNTGTGTQPYAYYYIDDVSVICCDCEDTSSTTSNNLFIPNAFSPNNDGHNDVLRVLGTASKIEFKVFDRWGEMVYSYTGGEMLQGTGWDGTYKGKALDNAVFVYFAKVTLLDGKEVELRGNVSLIK